MTVSNQNNRTSVVGTGAEQEIPFTFPITSTSDITVYKRLITSGEETKLEVTTDYIVTIDGTLGGTVTTVTPFHLTSAYEIHIIRDTPMTQTLDLVQGGSFNAENIETALDKSVRLIIENSNSLDRTLRFPETDADSIMEELPKAKTRAGKFLYFGADGNPSVAESITTGETTISPFGKELIADDGASAALTTLGFTPYAENLIDDTSAVIARGTLGLGTGDNVEFAKITSTDIISDGPWADIRIYGAKTSNADNAAEIQAAFDSGKSVLIPEGIFIVNSTLNWTTIDATLMFVSHKSIIIASDTFPFDEPLIHFFLEADSLRNCSIHNLHAICVGRASGITLTDCAAIIFYSPRIRGGRNGDDNYSLDIRSVNRHSGSIWVYGLHIYGEDEGGGIRMEGNGWDLHRCGFWGAHIQHVGHGIYLKGRVHGTHFSQMMVDITYDNAGAFGIKEETGVTNMQNVFSNLICENVYASGIGVDMQDTDSLSSCWDYWIVNFDTAYVFANNISQKRNWRIDGVQLRSRGRILVLNGVFDGYSPDASMTWDVNRSASVATGDWDKWDFALPLPNRSIINRITTDVYTDDGGADLKMQVWKQHSESGNWIQVGGDHDFTGDGVHTATIDYEIEMNYVVRVSILVKRAAGSFLYIYPLNVNADY